MEPAHLRDDLRAEVIAVLCERDDVAAMHERGELLFFAIRMVCNMIKSNRSTFARKYRTMHEELNGMDVADLPVNGRMQKEALEEPVYEIFLKLKPLVHSRSFTWCEDLKPIMKPYDQNIVSLYMKLGSFRLIEEETGIPWESCYKTFNNAMRKIKEHVGV